MQASGPAAARAPGRLKMTGWVLLPRRWASFDLPRRNLREAMASNVWEIAMNHIRPRRAARIADHPPSFSGGRSMRSGQRLRSTTLALRGHDLIRTGEIGRAPCRERVCQYV